MHVDGSGSRGMAHAQHSRVHEQRHTAAKGRVEHDARMKPASEPGVAGNPPTESTRPPTMEPKAEGGVLSLLQQGHFKGVAAARLRVVHFDRLAALEPPAPSEADIEGATASLVDTASQQVANASDSLSEESRTALAAAVDSLRDGLAAPDASVGSVAELRTQLESGVEAFVAAATPHLEPAAVASLSEALDASLLQSLEALDARAIVPEPQRGNGNGVAFDRFMAQYQALVDSAAAMSEPVEGATADAPATPVSELPDELASTDPIELAPEMMEDVPRIDTTA